MSRWRERQILGVTTAAFFVTMFARLVTSPLVPQITDAFSVSNGQVGLAFSGMWAAYALFQFPGGVLADRIGETRVVAIAIGATGVTTLALGLSPTFPVFAILAVGVGAASGLYFTAGVAFLSNQFQNTGRALGIHEIGASAGGLVAPVAAAYLAARLDWRAGPLAATAIAAAALALFVWRAPATSPENLDASIRDQLNVRRLLDLLSRRTILFTTAIAMLGFFTWQAFASFFPTFLVEYGGLSTSRASVIFGAVFAFTLVGSPALGRVSDTIGRDVVLGGAFLAGAAGYATFLLGTGPLVHGGGVILVGLGLSWPGVMNSRFMDNLAPDERGTGFGLVRTVVLLVSSLGSGVTGLLVDVAGWETAYGFVAGLLGTLVVLLVLNRALGTNA
jgi:predicted MFS family arabinose efflux permease